MKLYLALPLFLLAVSAVAQASVSLQANTTTWFIANVTFNPRLSSEYEGCWPNGALTLSNNQFNSFFTASGWTGPACEDYELFGEESFYIANGSHYGYIGDNDSVQFNYNPINSSMMILNLWFGCDGNQYCDKPADVILLLDNLDPYPCIFNFDLYTVNICPFSSTSFGDSYGKGTWNYSVSLLDNIVPSCDGSQQIWGTFGDYNGCHDIATQKPSYTFQNPGVPTDSSLNILFPVQESSTSSTNFQLSITLNCDPTKSFIGLKNVATNLSSNLTTISLGGYSPSACAQPIACSAVPLGYSNYYNLCPLQQSNLVLKKSDGVLGELSFNLGSTPLTPNCAGSNGSYVFATYTTRDNCFTLAENALTYLEYSSDNNSGLQVVFPQFTSPGNFYVNVTIQLQCRASQLSVVAFDSAMNFNAQTGGPFGVVYAYPTLQGTSPYACPITPNRTETLGA